MTNLKAVDEMFADIEGESVAGKAAVRGAQGDTHEQAKAKIVANINANIAAIASGTGTHNPLYTDLSVSPVYVGVKYGNHWLKSWLFIDGQLQTYRKCKPESVVANLEKLRQLIESDYALEVIDDLREKNRNAALARRR